jgi:hypothetical protein
MPNTIAEVVPDQPTIKLYQKDFLAIKNIDVDDKCCLHVKVKAKSKYREDYMEGEPLCITFQVVKVTECEDD